MRIDDSRCRTENYADGRTLFRAQTLKLNTLAINPAFMRSSRDIEGVTRMCDAESVEREGGGREGENCVHAPISRGEGCSVSMVTRWLIGRTTDAGRRWCVGVGWKILGRIPCSLWSIIPHQERGWLWSVQWPWQCPITSRKLHHNMRGECVFSLPLKLNPPFYNSA